MRYSPLMLAAAAVIGVYTASGFGLERALFVICIAALFVIVYAFISKKIDIMLLMVLAVFSAGALSYTFAVSDHMHELNGYEKRYAVLRGIVEEPGRENSYDDNIKYTVSITGIETDGEMEELRDKLAVTTPEKLSCGDEIILKGIVKKIPDQMNDDGADMKEYYKSLGIFKKMYTEDITVTGSAPWWYPQLIGGRIREGIDRAIYSCYSGDGAAVLSAVLTGNGHHFSERYKEAVNNTAVKRMLHPAYLYILVITFAVGLFSEIINKRYRDTAVVIIMLIFALIGGGVGFTRCMLTGVAAFVIRRISGTGYYIDTMSWLVMLCALISPLIMFNSGFIMSISAGIAVWAFMPIFSKHVRFFQGWVGRTILVVIICIVFTTPISAQYFRGICIYAPVLSVIMMPVVAMLIVLAPLTLIIHAIFGAAPVIGGYVDFLLWAVIRLTYLVEALPFSQISIPAPGTAGTLMFISAEMWLYYYMKKIKIKAAVCASVSAGLFTALAVTSVSMIGTAEFTFVNVGQGDGSVINTKYAETVLIDGGGGSEFSEYNPGKEIFVPYLMAKGRNRIDAAFVSHFHKDHAQGIIAAVKSLKVENVFAPQPQEDWSEDMLGLAAELESAADENGTELHYISEDMRVTFDGGLILDIYVPNELTQISDDENDTSLLIKAEYNGVKFLYTGDITSFGEHAALTAGTDVDADILKVGHHGSRGSSSSEWLDAVSPEYAVISCGEDNVYGHPADETIGRLGDITVLRTDYRGDITFRVGRSGDIKVKSLR